jgi:hypothetical protein
MEWGGRACAIMKKVPTDNFQVDKYNYKARFAHIRAFEYRVSIWSRYRYVIFQNYSLMENDTGMTYYTRLCRDLMAQGIQSRRREYLKMRLNVL